MKKNMFYLVLLALMAACNKPPSVSVSCNSPTKDVSIAQKLIIGKWVWVYSNHYNRLLGKNELWTPEVKDIIRVMEFDTKGNLSMFEDGKLTAQTTYEFQKYSVSTNIPADSTRFVLLCKGRGNTFFKICSDSMYLPYQSFGYDASGDEVWMKN